MIADSREYFRHAIRITAAVGTVISLSGCIVALPPAVQMASLALDGVSYLATGKSVTDHAISTVTAQDCAMLRALKGDTICVEVVVETAALPDGTIVPDATNAASTILTAEHDETFQAFSATHVTAVDRDADEVLDNPESAANHLDMRTASGPML